MASGRRYSGVSDWTGFLKDAPNAGDKALLDVRLQQDVVHASDNCFRPYVIVGIAGNEDNWCGDIAAAQSACEIDTVNIGHFIVDHKAVGLFCCGCIQQRWPVPERLDVESVGFKQKPQRAEDARVVIDNVYDRSCG